MTPYLIDNKLVIDIQTKANIFNKFFAEECAPLKNNRVLPKSQTFLTPSRLCYLDFNKHDILKIMRALNINKAHGHDDIFNRMIEIKTKSLLKPLTFLFEYSIKKILLPRHMEKIQYYTCAYKARQTLDTNHRPISLLPIFGKIFEKIIVNRIYNFVLEENLLNPYQSGFRPSVSCVNQLIAVTHDIFGACNCDPPLEVRSVFLDISKTFDKIWHEGLLYKAKSM